MYHVVRTVAPSNVIPTCRARSPCKHEGEVISTASVASHLHKSVIGQYYCRVGKEGDGGGVGVYKASHVSSSMGAAITATHSGKGILLIVLLT